MAGTADPSLADEGLDVSVVSELVDGLKGTPNGATEGTSRLASVEGLPKAYLPL